MNKTHSKFKEYRVLGICIALFVVFVALACFSGAWPSSDFAAQILAALAGAVVAAIITLFLLNGQTESEAKKDKDSKVFEEKLRIYQEFMKELCGVVKDKNIDEAEEICLQFYVAAIAIHTSEDSILIISEQVKSIIWNLKEGKDDKKEMLDQLFVISQVFHEELYKDAAKIDEKKRMRTIQNFHIFLVKQTELETYAEDSKKQIERVYELEKKLTVEERVVLLQSKIPANGSKQWIYKGTTLVHDFYTKIGARGSYINSNQNIGMDLRLINSNKFELTVFSRTWNDDDTLKIVQGIGEDATKPLVNSRYVLAIFDESDSNDKIAQFISEMLVKIKEYRDKTFK
ncbi:MAG: hypothetical protein MJZ79_04465 [Paludibacteraceae bacterium]|nr:hypothetical protein [Paludibacteraceae bacterium]